MSDGSTRALTGADIIAKRLAFAGCKRAFGIPGGEVLALVEALEAADISFHLAKHENAAGFMAEGGWHAEPEAPGILVATLGPGVANAINVVANAMQDRVPLIFLTGCVDAEMAKSYTHQVFDHQAVLRPIVKASFRAGEFNIDAMMRKAIAKAMDGQPGPVHIDVPIGVAESATDDELTDDRTVLYSRWPVDPPQVPTEERTEVDRLMRDARRPLVIAGVDAVNADAGPTLRAFAERTGIPVITTYKGKGLLDEATDALCLGGHGLSPKSDKVILPLIKQADCVLLAGYDPIEMRAGWRFPFSKTARVIEISRVWRSHGMHEATLEVDDHLPDMLDAIGPRSDPAWPDGEIEAARAALAEAFPTPTEWGPGQVFATLNEALPDATVITADSGAHRILLSQMWRSRHPRHFLQSTALCTMGCAVPLATGYKLAAPETPVCAFIGDAGMEMILGELATLRDTRLPVLVCVLVDEQLGLIEMKQRASQRPNAGVDFDGSDFPAIAEALGGHGVWIEDAEMLREEAVAGLERDTFTLLACRIGRRAYDGTF